MAVVDGGGVQEGPAVVGGRCVGCHGYGFYYASEGRWICGGLLLRVLIFLHAAHLIHDSRTCTGFKIFMGGNYGTITGSQTRTPASTRH